MLSRAIKVGDRVLVEIQGIQFEAIVRSKQPRNLGIDPVDPVRHTWRHCSVRSIVRKVGA